jgi:hypothetical protein
MVCKAFRFWNAVGVVIFTASLWGCVKMGNVEGTGGSGGVWRGSGGFSAGTGGFFTGGTGGFLPRGSGGESSSTCGTPVGSGGSKVGMSASAPILSGVTTADTPPPAISGGTLLVLSNGTTAVAADPDRDRVYVVNIASASVITTVALHAGDEPGRLVEDGAGNVHVALRGGAAIATIDPTTGQVTMRRAACATPRGIAYAPSAGLLYLACASGELMVFTPTAATPAMTWTLDQDLRDVVIDGDRLLVTRFRSAEVLEVDAATGTITGRQRPPTFSNPLVHLGEAFEPAVAWRAAPLPGGGMVMAHQRGMNGKIIPTAGGYGGGETCGGIVHSCVSKMKRGGKAAAGPAFDGFVLPVDIAVSPSGNQVAMVAAGNGHASVGTARRLFITRTDDATQEWPGGCGADGQHGPSPFPLCPGSGTGGAIMVGPSVGTGGFVGTGGSIGSGGTSSGAGGSQGPGVMTSSAAGGTVGRDIPAQGTGASTGTTTVGCGQDPIDEGEPTAVAYAAEDVVLVQTREPAQLLIVRELSAGTTAKTIVSLSSESRADTGHALFHANSGGGLACASCHPEGHDDGRIWTFDCEGARRTQDPSGGLLGTEPFHWNGDMTNFQTLVQNVFVQRMSGPALPAEHVRALQGWIDRLPTLPPLRPSSASDSQVARGKALFESSSVGCASCHAGSALTNDMTVSVGTGATFQVPSLRGVGWRAPYMHDGCAATLDDRFTDATCGGGDQHGVTSHLTASDRADLIAYLQSL